MKSKKYSIFGAGAAGLYTAWRLLSGETSGQKGKAKMLVKGDTLELYDWGQYDFSKSNPGSREPGARVCTWHYNHDKEESYVELGGMRYSKWDQKPSEQFPDPNDGLAPGHRLVSKVIEQLGLDKFSVPFNESVNPLFYLRTKNMFLNDITSFSPAPYNADHYGAATSPNQGFATVESLSGSAITPKTTRKDWCKFYDEGTINVDMPDTSVFQKGNKLKDIGYWNLLYDQLGSEGYNYAADGNGYTSNVINWNSAVAFNANNEFTPGNAYSTLTTGYSGMFTALFDAIVEAAKKKGIHFKYHPNTRLHAIWYEKNKVHYTFASRANPWKPGGQETTDAAWMAMPRYAIDLVAQATRYEKSEGRLDVLNHKKVQLYLESVVMQPSYKVGMFFDDPWWTAAGKTPAVYMPHLTAYEITPAVIQVLTSLGFPDAYLQKIAADESIMNQSFTPAPDFKKAVEECIGERLTLNEENQLLNAALNNTIGPSITDTPLRMVVYFGDNSLKKTAEGRKPIYGILASYDDEQYTSFWSELELEPDEERTIPGSDNIQPLIGPKKVPCGMKKMLRKQLAEMHYGPNSDYQSVPEPLEAMYMDWSLPPFNAGYHVWAAHYNIGEVQRKIRKPTQLIPKTDANIFIVGEAYSNDQAWVEGAYCTAESVLNDFFYMDPLIDNKEYPFICPAI
jgi:hypothetical protein